jgi:hypothetical protein
MISPSAKRLLTSLTSAPIAANRPTAPTSASAADRRPTPPAEAAPFSITTRFGAILVNDPCC